MGIELYDPDLKRERGYVDPASRVFLDGREVLAGKDWKTRVEELAARSGGLCENPKGASLQVGVIVFHKCGAPAVHPHHNVLRSILRDDRLEKLLHVCGWCHAKLDAQQRQAKRDARKVRMSL